MLLLALRWGSAQRASPGTALDFLPGGGWGRPITHHEASISADTVCSDTVEDRSLRQPCTACPLHLSSVLCSLRALPDRVVPSSLPVLYWVPERINAPAPLCMAELCPSFKI